MDLSCCSFEIGNLLYLLQQSWKILSRTQGALISYGERYLCRMASFRFGEVEIMLEPELKIGCFFCAWNGLCCC